ncbi:MAG: hypothetical protein NVSMB5_13030 [Candidatus Velthaea sp.]
MHGMTKRLLLALLAAFAFTGSAVSAQTTPAAAVLNAKTYAFVPHAVFFSLESKQANLLDPHVFVAAGEVSAAVGPQGIPHAAGYRPAFAVDDPSTTLSNARGEGIRITLAQWFGANGKVTLTPGSGTTTAAFKFNGLIPRARYSLFENHFAAEGVTFTPLDGSAQTNSFTASPDGSASFTITIPGAVTHAEAILLVWHSDGLDHGMQRGAIGVNAHHQLIMRVP